MGFEGAKTIFVNSYVQTGMNDSCERYFGAKKADLCIASICLASIFCSLRNMCAVDFTKTSLIFVEKCTISLYSQFMCFKSEKLKHRSCALRSRIQHQTGSLCR